MVGGSYGGALALLLAAARPAGRRDRPDDHLERPLHRAPARVERPGRHRRRLQEGLGRGLLRQRRARHRPHRRVPRSPRRRAAPASPSTRPAAGSPPTSAPRTCGSPRPGRPTRRPSRCCKESSPAAVLDRIKAPTLLIQGEADSLFPLAEADANARGIAATGTPVRVAWFTGGHDGGDGPQTDSDRVPLPDGAVARPLRQGRGRGAGGQLHLVAGRRLQRAWTGGWSPPASRPTTTRGWAGESTLAVPVAGPPQPVANPPGGNPAALSSLPGAGALSLAGRPASAATSPASTRSSSPRRWPSRWTSSARRPSRSGPPPRPARRCSSSSSTTSTRTARATLPGGLVAPVRLTGLPADIADGRAGHGHPARDRAPLRVRPPAAAGGRHLRPGVRRPRPSRPSTRSPPATARSCSPPSSARRSPPRRRSGAGC